MDILILGNGFDIAHGLKTKYSDFLDYCSEQPNPPLTYIPSNPFLTNMWIRHFMYIQEQMGNKWIDLENEIYNVIKHIAGLSILKIQNYSGYFLIDFNNNSFNFYNFENYINKTVFSMNTGLKGYARHNENDWLSYRVYFDNANGIINFLYDQLRDFTTLFEQYLQNEVLSNINEAEKFRLSLKSIGVNRGDKDVHVLSFNYTDTCKKLYDQKFNTYCDINIKPVYVHGVVSTNNDCNLILGTHGFEDSNDTIPADFNIFKKHNQRHKYGTIEPYQDLLRKIKKSRSIPVFHIIGHSLDNTDKNILKHILLANPDSKINIYYHDEEAQERLMNNIDSIIGEDEVMAKVRFINQHNSERGILIPLKNAI